MTKDSTWWLPLLLIGVLVLYYHNTADSRAVALLDYDGTPDNFQLVSGNFSGQVDQDSLYTTDVIVSNWGAPGHMYVYCRLLANTTGWLSGYPDTQAAVTFLPPTDPGAACLFTSNGQAATVNLTTNESVRIPYSFIAPHTNGTYALYCAAVERCWMNSTENELRSAYLRHTINVTVRGTVSTTPVNYTYLCTYDQDCDAYSYMGAQRCVTGRCVDEADLAALNQTGGISDGGTPASLKGIQDWITQNRNLAIGLGVALIVGGAYLFTRKKRK